MEYINYELQINPNLLEILKQYIYETEHDEISYDDVNDFIIEAIVEKFNAENEIYDGEIDENGFTDNRSILEHYLCINRDK